MKQKILFIEVDYVCCACVQLLWHSIKTMIVEKRGRSVEMVTSGLFHKSASRVSWQSRSQEVGHQTFTLGAQSPHFGQPRRQL